MLLPVNRQAFFCVVVVEKAPLSAGNMPVIENLVWSHIFHCMKKLFYLVVLSFSFSTAEAQSAEDSVKAIVTKLFEAMRKSDSVALQECFADSAILQTITSSGTIRNESVKRFVSQISSLPKNAADERINFDAIKIDGSLAAVWTPYQFYFKGAFSHCGVNSFQLVRLNGSWKIQYLIDTRRKTNCR